MRALRFPVPVWFTASSSCCSSNSGILWLALVQRALDVGDGVELGACLIELLAKPRVLVDLGLQTAVGVRRAHLILPYRVGLQPAVFSDQRQMVVNLRKLEEREGALGREERLRVRHQLAQQ